MAKPRNQYHAGVRKAIRNAKKALAIFEMMDTFCESGDDFKAFELSKEANHCVGNLMVNARYLAIITGDPSAVREFERVLLEEVPIEMGYTEQGWFLLKMPRILPRKEKGSIKDLRILLDAAFRRYPLKFPDVPLFSECVIAYRHVYDEDLPEQQWRDHDNIELNFVTDIVAQYVMEDDAPKKCHHHYMSSAGSEAHTEVYVVPKNEFIKWFDLALDEGLTIADSGSLN